jgi:pimeloyl-ACP methyl ester carboxylesterase
VTKPVLVLVHGRAQGGKDPIQLRQIWLDTLAAGLGSNRASQLSKFEIRFPFYGDTLDELVSRMTNVPVDLTMRGDPAGIDPGFLEFEREIAEEARLKRGITDDQILDHMPDVIERGALQLRWVQATLRTLDQVPGLSGKMLERFTRDVYLYLERDFVRRAINKVVAEAIGPGERLVVIGHSLGSVVAYDVMRQTQGLNVAAFCTVGSPLGVRPIRAKLAPIRFPSGVDRWFNAFDERDAVALYPLDTANFAVTPPIENHNEVQNGTDNAHGIIGYLNNAVVADQIWSALTGE